MPKRNESQRHKKSSWSAHCPKRGKVRSLIKKPSGKTKPMKNYHPVPYVRHGEGTNKNRTERQRWGHSISNFMNMRNKTLIRILTKEGILPDWTGKDCDIVVSASLGSSSVTLRVTLWHTAVELRNATSSYRPTISIPSSLAAPVTATHL